MRHAVLALVAATALAACSKDAPAPSAPPQPGCSLMPGTWLCFTDPAATAVTCAAETGSWLAGGCPGGDLSGICHEPSGRTTYFYYDFSGTSWSYPTYAADEMCWIAGGTFEPMGARVAGWCDLRSTAYLYCLEAAGTESDMAESETVYGCESYGQTWHTTGACPVAGRSGTCSGIDQGIEYSRRYYDSATAQDDAASCAIASGTWTAG